MKQSVFVARNADTPSSETPSLSSSLPPDILREASQRLGWAGLAYAGTYFLAAFGPLFAMWAGLFPEHAHLSPLPTTVAVISIALGLAVFFLSRRSSLPPQRLLDLGLVFEVVGAFGISMAQFWGAFPTWDISTVLAGYAGVPWEGVWIIMFPLLAPNTPRKTLIASLAAASTGLVVVSLSKATGNSAANLSLGFFVVYFLFTTYLCAALAVFISRYVYRYGLRLKKAREVGSYELVKRLGLGGMGEVWAARHRMLARPAAIKLIRPELLGSATETRQTLLRRFEREAQATAALRSTHTVHIYDYGISADGAFFYVMELLNGLSLDELVNRFGPVPAGRVVYMLRQICHSLGEAHASALIHRDIKPANIYTCHLGPDYDFVKVLDFGLVKPTRKGADDVKLTAEGVVAGTPAYMPPEAALGKKTDGRSDLYSVGCVGYWLLTGQHVFQADTSMAAIVEHVKSAPVPPSRVTELEIPQALEQAILACLEKEPSDRPQTAEELEARLAASVPAGAWSCELAKEWWHLHLPVGGTVEMEAAPESPIQVARVEL